MPPEPPEMSVQTLIERVTGQHAETLRCFAEMKAQISSLSVAVMTHETRLTSLEAQQGIAHESRITTLEAKQGMIIKIIFAVASAAGIGGAGVFGVFNLLGN